MRGQNGSREQQAEQMEDCRAPRTYGHGSTRNKRYGRRVQKYKRSWTRWTTSERSLSWADISQYEPLRLKFLLISVYDVLPSPVNLCQWDLTDNPNCRLFEKRGTLDPIMSSCKVAHDKVLRELAHILELQKRNTPLASPSSL